MKPSREQAKEALRVFLSYLGEDPDRPSLLKTPERFIGAWDQEWGASYSPNYVAHALEKIKEGQFEDGAEHYDGMVVETGIPYYSHCSHHLALFSGTVDLGYIPNGKVLGLSKLVRLVELASRKLQIQEQLTREIADYMMNIATPLGVGVIVSGTHNCMCSRGVRVNGVDAITSAMRGEFLEDPAVKSEFLTLIKLRN